MRLSPKEKADELVDSMNIPYIDGEYYNMSFYQQTQCALIVVNEILKAREVSIGGLILDEDYWQEVKEEIEKL